MVRLHGWTRVEVLSPTERHGLSGGMYGGGLTRDNSFRILGRILRCRVRAGIIFFFFPARLTGGNLKLRVDCGRHMNLRSERMGSVGLDRTDLSRQRDRERARCTASDWLVSFNLFFPLVTPRSVGCGNDGGDHSAFLGSW